MIATVPAQAQTACAFETPPLVLMENGDPHAQGSRLLQVWEMRDDPVFWSQAEPASPDYQRFKAQVAERNIDTDPVRLLERSPTDNNRIVLQNAGAWIGPAGCLEMLLYGYQHARMDTLEVPTEFASIILRSPDEARLRVYFTTVNQDGLGNMDPIVEPVLIDKRAGWQVLVALHSHVFHPGQPEIDGIPAPSEPDADFHVRLHEASGLREAWITNGVDTVRMPASSFDGFTRPSSASDPSE